MELHTWLDVYQPLATYCMSKITGFNPELPDREN